MNIKMLKVAAAGLILSTSTFANAGLIDFNSMSEGIYSGNSDFTVTSYGGPESDASLTPIIRNQAGTTYLCNSTEITDTGCSYPTEDIIDFDFNIGLDSLTLSMNWAGNPSSGGTGATVNSYDISGNLLESFGYLGSTNATYTFDSTSDIYSIQTNSGLTSRNDWWYGINSINYTAAEVPEPTTLAIFSLGIMGLAARRFKK
jgi:hypothetical protein|tara:strand:+ start:13464 stop:14069 length:606 start_codon:yes stop_codon:yes gene_type:complete